MVKNLLGGGKNLPASPTAAISAYTGEKRTLTKSVPRNFKTEIKNVYGKSSSHTKLNFLRKRSIKEMLKNYDKRFHCTDE